MTTGTGAEFEVSHQYLAMSPSAFNSDRTSLVIPVRNNQRGLDRFLAASRELDDAPREVIVVDSASSVPVRVPNEIRLVRVERPGAARARNAGWRTATGEWILFCDSDCVPTATTLSGYASAINGSLAYAGTTRSMSPGMLSDYYDRQGLLAPPPDRDNRPVYLVTANALVYRDALVAIGGFYESFPSAGGEDIDLAYRLRHLGALSYAPESIILHDFGDGALGFIRRCLRYGRGNRLLEARHQRAHVPRMFSPRVRVPSHYALAFSQFLLMRGGYLLSGLID